MSRTFKPTEGSQTFDFALEHTPGLSGIVVLPNGSRPPREVAVATEKTAVSLRSGRFDHVMNFFDSRGRA